MIVFGGLNSEGYLGSSVMVLELGNNLISFFFNFLMI